MSRLVRARFVPQAWVNDYAVNVDCEGPDTFDVTLEIRAMGREAANRLQPDTYESDELRFAAAAPDWVKNWSGPFYVEVLDDVSAAFDGEGAYLDRFPAEARPYCDRAYDDGYCDGCEAAESLAAAVAEYLDAGSAGKLESALADYKAGKTGAPPPDNVAALVLAARRLLAQVREADDFRLRRGIEAAALERALQPFDDVTWPEPGAGESEQ